VAPVQVEDSPAKQIREDIVSARKAMKEKNWAQAQQLANSVLTNAEASKAQRKQAENILKEARAKQRREEIGASRHAAGPVGFVKHPSKDGEIAVWAHDDSVQPGKTYRYRLRVKLWNRYVGRRQALAEPAQADQVVLAGEWSLPSAPITVAPRQHFFVRGPVYGETAANVEVYTWHKGDWLKQDFKVKVGDVIGTAMDVKVGEDEKKAKRERVDFCTNAIVLDVRPDEPVQFRMSAGKGEFRYRDTKSLVLVYLDPVDGQVKERIAEFDKNDPVKKRLSEQTEEGA
jgi:hypothetical protein